MYANPAVVADPASAGQLLEALLAERRMPTPVPPSSSSATLDTFRSLQLQPPDLASFPRAHGSAAYIIPYQGLVRTYAEVELGVDGGSGGGGGGSGRDPSAPPPAPTGAAPTPSALKSLREFVSAGGNLVLLGNTGEQAALGLIQRVLDRPPGCRPAAVRFRARAGGAAAAAEDASAAALPPVLAAVRTPDVFLPLGGTGPECGGAVGMLECMPATGPAAAAAGAAAAPAAAGPVPWFDRVGTGRGGAAAGLDEAMVGPGFVWPHGRGRVIWLGATFDSATSVDWVRLLAAAALAPPLPAGYWDTPPPARPPPPPLGPSVPPYPPEDPGFPEPPEAPVFPPAMPSPPPSPPCEPCQDYPADGYYNCTAWMEVPDVDFCDPDFYVDPPPSGSSNSSGGPGGEAAPLLSVLRDVCPRSCGQCCADLYYECGAWWEQGYCSWLYTISDPDDPGLVQDVPRACQASCQTCDGSGSSNTGSSGSAPPPPVPSPAAALAPGTNGVVSPRRRALLGRDKQNVNKGSKSAAGNAPVSRAKPLAKPQDWKDGDLAPNADKSQAKRKDSPLKQLSDMLSDSNTRDKLLDAAYNSGVGQRLVPGTGIRGDPHIDLQKPFAVNSAGDGKKVTMKDGREVRFAAVDFQTQSTNKLSDSFARAYVPLGYSVHQDVISAALMRSARTQRTVTILPPPARGDNGALRSFTQFSQVDPEDTNVRWTLVEGKVASDPPTGWDTKAQAVNNVLFGGGEGGTIALAAQQEADVGVATYDRGAFTSKAGNDDNWGIDSSCGRKGARLLLQGCSSGGGGGSSGGGSSSSGGDGGWAGDDDNGDGKKKVCKVTYVRLKDGRRVRRRVCKTVRSQG
ncbi:hypothetical protein HYH02_010838 [Chlamydomonas schloesseri]|uniref:Uncharacterized protein n=1 Tax=Chlamydomonas schloesseri TaxID=2026947 RepID=A0A835T412_9CHLO|nr:hypothetical protein HYH02_010838 [Chlamydomonas schloesseri]|eukprot:KAG2438383.1 hypothetical protein HYH02_010838 [Chlamydomonas schloesseri]